MSNNFDSLLPSQEEGMTVEDARNLLLAPTPVPSIADARSLLATDRSAGISTLAEAKRNIFGISSPEVPSKVEEKAQTLANKIQEKQQQLSQQPIISDEGADTLLGGIGNAAMALRQGAINVGGTLLTAGSEVLNYLDNIGITAEDSAIFTEIRGKQSAGIPLTPQEEEWLQPEVQVGTAGQPIQPGPSKYEKLEDVEQRQQFIDAIEYGVAENAKLVNTTKQATALNDVGITAEKAVDQFSEGNIIQGIGTFIGGVASLATDHPAAATELTLNSLPQMFVLAKNAVLGVSTLTAQGYGDAIQEFEEEYKRAPDESEKAIAGILSLTAAGLDAFGAKFALGGQKLLQGFKDLSKKSGIKIADVTFDIAKKAIASGTVQAVKTVGRPISTAVVEGATEGAQSTLSQLAGKQDISKVSSKEALTEATIGSVAGGFISSPGAAVETADLIRKGVNQAAGVAVTAATKAGIGKTNDIIETAKETNDIETGINAIRETDFSTIPVEQQDKLLDDYEDLITQYESDPNLNVDLLIQYERELNTLVDVIIDSRSKNSVSEAVEALDTAEVAKEVAEQAVETIATHVRNSATISPSLVQRTLGSDSSFRDNATPEQIKVVEDLQEFQEAVNVARNIDNVTDDVIKGTEGGKFIGIETHMRNAKRAIRKGDTKAVDVVLSKLSNFLQVQNAKLQIKTHSPKFISQIQNEVNLIESTIQQIKTLSGKVQAEAQPKAKPEVVADKPKVVKKPKKVISVKDFFEYKDGKPIKKKANIATLSAEFRKGKSKAELAAMRVEYTKILDEIRGIQYTTLSKINITREEGEEAITFNAGQEFETLTKRMSGLEQIWKECK
jgi:hypothetical protein